MSIGSRSVEPPKSAQLLRGLARASHGHELSQDGCRGPEPYTGFLLRGFDLSYHSRDLK